MKRFILVLCLQVPAAALADKIDGAWCSLAQHIDIDGPKITLTDKTVVEGKYARHEFLYTVPEGQTAAGAQIYMRLRGEEDMTSVTIKDGKGEDPIDWKRCTATS